MIEGIEERLILHAVKSHLLFPMHGLALRRTYHLLWSALLASTFIRMSRSECENECIFSILSLFCFARVEHSTHELCAADMSETLGPRHTTFQ